MSEKKPTGTLERCRAPYRHRGTPTLLLPSACGLQTSQVRPRQSLDRPKPAAPAACLCQYCNTLARRTQRMCGFRRFHAAKRERLVFSTSLSGQKRASSVRLGATVGMIGRKI
eukprot:769046-Prymnesium_polylepis.1